MGKPATDWFCENGHHFDSGDHHEFCPTDLNEGQCTICGSKQVRVVIEWCDGVDNPVVPFDPASFCIQEKIDFRGNKYYVQLPIYNVTKLFKNKSRA